MRLILKYEGEYYVVERRRMRLILRYMRVNIMMWRGVG